MGARFLDEPTVSGSARPKMIPDSRSVGLYYRKWGKMSKFLISGYGPIRYGSSGGIFK